ncbi:MAG TPA: hypothetical protein VJN62_11200 [Gemmatimonadales bacterium]|nr:hypothetical protein [Gemmatimonadales bacterium]
MTRLTGLVLGFLAVGVVACNDFSSSAERVLAAGSVPLDSKGGVTPVSLVVTVSNADSLGNPYGITNDGQGTYVDGQQYVSAVLDQYGTLAFNTFVPPKSFKGPAPRWVSYDFSHPVDPANSFRPTQDHTQVYHFSSGGSGILPWVPLQNLGINGNPSTECGYMGNSFSDLTGTAYRVSYHKGLEDTQGSPTAYAVFTRTSVSPAIWTVTPVGSCSGNSNVASLRNDATNFLYGYYAIPFFFTLTAR